MRLGRDLTQVQLAQAAGVGQTTISRMEKDPPERTTLRNAEKVARVLGVGLEEIVTLPAPMGLVAEDDPRLDAIDLSGLSPEGRAQVRAYYRFTAEQEARVRAVTPAGTAH